MTTKQNDAGAMTQKQLAGVSGGPHYSDWHALGHNVIQRRRSNRTRHTGVDADALLPAVQAVAFEGLGVVLEDLYR